MKILRETKDYCDNSPDFIFGYDVTEACAIHDVRYINSWSDEIEQPYTRRSADVEFLHNLKESLPRYLHFIAYLYYFGVRMFGGKYWNE